MGKRTLLEQIIWIFKAHPRRAVLKYFRLVDPGHLSQLRQSVKLQRILLLNAKRLSRPRPALAWVKK